MIGRLGLNIRALFGDENAKRATRELGRLDEFKRWDDARAQSEPALREDADGLTRFSATAAEPAGEQLNALTRAASDLASLRPQIEAAATREEWLTVGTLLDRADGARQAWSAAAEAIGTAATEHRDRQNVVWQQFRDALAVQRAGVMADELASSPELPGLPKPDVSEFHNAFRRVLDAVPQDYGADGREAVAFDPARVEADVETAIARAQDADVALTKYFFEATRGYQQALGPERTAELTAMLRDPRQAAELQGRYPQLFQQRTALQGDASGGGGMLPNMFMMLLMFQMMSAVTPATAWAAPPPVPPNPDGTPPVNNWLADVGAPADVGVGADASAGSLDETYDDADVDGDDW